MADLGAAVTLILLGIASLLIGFFFLSSNAGLGVLSLVIGLCLIIGGIWIPFKGDDRVRGRHF